MKFVGYIYGEFATPIYENEGFYYVNTGFCYSSIGNISFANKQFKNNNLKIYKLN